MSFQLRWCYRGDLGLLNAVVSYGFYRQIEWEGDCPSVVSVSAYRWGNESSAEGSIVSAILITSCGAVYLPHADREG